MKNLTQVVLTFSLGIIFVACSSKPAVVMNLTPIVAEAVLVSGTGKKLSLVSFTDTSKGVQVKLVVKGLKPNAEHGLHIHEGKECTGPTFMSAGGHFNPHQSKHGDLHSVERHPGDFGNLKADAKGVATLDVFVPGITLRDSVPESVLGHALILHDGKDDLKSQPTGNSGSRKGCGLITLVSP